MGQQQSSSSSSSSQPTIDNISKTTTSLSLFYQNATNFLHKLPKLTHNDMREIVASNTHPFHRHGQLMANDADVGNMLFLPNIMETAREYLLLTTIPVATTPEEYMLIQNTLTPMQDERLINALLQCQKPRVKDQYFLIIYGKNANDLVAILTKYRMLTDLGFTKVAVYLGGMLEWVLLQQVYGAVMYPTYQPFVVAKSLVSSSADVMPPPIPSSSAAAVVSVVDNTTTTASRVPHFT